MGGLHFNPADIQATGVGVAAFLATVLALFVFLSARQERLGRAMLLALVASSIWAWFGFLYHIVSDIEIARAMRVVSVMGIVGISTAELNFALVYLSERVTATRTLTWIRNAVYAAGAFFVLLLLADLLGARLLVGDLLLPTDSVLAPDAGPLFGILIAFYATGIALGGIFLAWRARAASDEVDRRQALLLFVSMTVGLALGGLRFTPWYGFDFYPMVGNIGFPLFFFATMYSITRYRLLNLEVVAATFLIFVLWTFTFLRILLEPSLAAALPDIGLFIAAVVLGVLLLRVSIAQLRSQKEIARITIDAARSEFITVAAHQLRTPVAALRWSFNLLQEDESGLNDMQRGIIEKGGRAADNMARIVNDLLDIGHMADGTFRFALAPGDLKTLLDTCIRLQEDAAKRKQITITSRIADNLPQIAFDPDKLSLAIQNLIDNAIKYSPEKGSVEVSAVQSGETVRITVHDSGIGFTADESKRVFERFFRSPRAVRVSPDGSGLGLAIAKTIVTGHGGTISVLSEENKGAAITITLPTKVVPPAEK